MQDASPSTALDAREFRRVWRIVTIAGLLGTAYLSLCVWGVPRVKFLRAMGATPFHFGLIAALAAAALGFQVFSGLWAARLRRRKRTWMILALLHRGAFALVLLSAAPFFPAPWRVWWIIAAFFVHDAFMHLSAPIWLAWMSDLMPEGSQNRHWGGRQRLVSLVNVIVWLVVAFGYHEFERRGMVVVGFAAIATVGLVLGFIEILMFLSVPDPELEVERPQPMLRSILAPLRDRDFRPFLRYSTVLHLAVLSGASFYALYMVEVLGLSSRDSQFAIAAYFLGMLIGSRLFGLLCDIYGKRPVLAFATFGRMSTALALALAPAAYGPAFVVALIGFFIDGVAAVGLLLAFQGLLLQATPRRSRAMYIAAANFFTVGIAGAIGPLAAGWFIDRAQNLSWAIGAWQLGPYQAVFLVCAAGTAGAGLLAMRVSDPGSVPLRRMLSHIFRTNPLRVASALHDLQESDNERRRVRAARILGAMRTPLGITGLIGALEDASRPVRRAAANALGKIGMGEAARPLTRALCNPESQIQLPAARALARIGDFDSRKALMENLRNLEPRVLERTIESLGKMGDTSAIAPLICLFREVEDEGVREKISDALALLGEKRLTDELFEIMVRRSTHRARRF